ncbi:S-adenosylmethionine mitochondrial carrier protein homolog [Spodoptera litura]|uniref:S-adenosylmethionine mitochondrial carrier protein homolog n=1 Tax=Spodoptera litura TaxID=69820 RepID=A0A9J7DZ44_SPOLT|nr:S-adenosylmethionine mitochondrial carrier protein homolog [Spodoptera litura]
MEQKSKPKSFKATHFPPLLAGAVAGVSVDVTLYPLDTLKTRLQSAQGFQKAGGFSGVYRGLATVAATSMPTTALFFVSYEATKRLCQPLVATQYTPMVHMFAASVGEVLACLIRVPTEIAKQRKQTYVGTNSKSSISILLHAYRTEGFFRGVYRGFGSTVLRDLPFSFIELPAWEMLKTTVRKYNNGEISSFQSAICGSIAGGFAAVLTTPLDLAKTRIMLSDGYRVSGKMKIRPVLTSIYIESGFKGLFAGAMPRMTAIMIGGFVFFGVYEDVKKYCEKYFEGR